MVASIHISKVHSYLNEVSCVLVCHLRADLATRRQHDEIYIDVLFVLMMDQTASPFPHRSTASQNVRFHSFSKWTKKLFVNFASRSCHKIRFKRRGNWYWTTSPAIAFPINSIALSTKYADHDPKIHGSSYPISFPIGPKTFLSSIDW